MSTIDPAKKSVTQTLEFETSTQVVLLRRCSKCKRPHPRAQGLDTDKCECGNMCDPPQKQDGGDSVATNYMTGNVDQRRLDVRLAHWCLKTAERLRNFAQRI